MRGLNGTGLTIFSEGSASEIFDFSGLERPSLVERTAPISSPMKVLPEIKP
jgi:hypothetical protein